MQSPHGDPMRRLGSTTAPQRLRLLIRPWLVSVLWSAWVLGCSLCVLLPSLVRAAEQTEVEYAKGIVEYGKGNYLEALEHFRIVVGLAPDDANARFYLGLTQLRVGESTAAIPQLERAVQLDPSLQYVHYHLGLAYFQEQRYVDALGQFREAVQVDPDNVAVYFYQGYALYQLKRYQEALAPFERMLQLDPTLSLSGQYYRGLTLFELQRDTQARDAFEAARATDPASTIGLNAQRYLEAIKARERDQRLWQVSGSVSFQYDDNVILEPNSIAISRQADGSTVFNVTGRVFALRTPLWQLGAEYDFFQSLHYNLHDFDLRSHTFGVFSRLKLDRVTLRLDANYTNTALDNAPFTESFTVQPNITIKQTDSLLALVSVQYRPENFYNEVLPGQDPAVRSRDGWNVRTGFDQFWLFNKQQAYARLGYHYDTQHTDGSDWDYNGHEVSLEVQTPLWAGVMFNVNGSYYRFNYQNVNSYSCCVDARGGLGILNADDTQSRTDNRYTAGVALSRDMGPYLTLSAGYTHINNQSNLAFYDYRRNLVTLAVSGRY